MKYQRNLLSSTNLNTTKYINRIYTSGIETSAFANNNDLVQLSIRSDVQYINKYAFKNCKNLVDLSIPGNVLSLGERVFENCQNLSGLFLRPGIKNIGRYAFNGCNKLSSVWIPNSIEVLGDYVFNKCEHLSSLNLPSSLMNIGKHIFNGCKQLLELNIPDIAISSISSVIGQTFSGITSLTNLNIKYNTNQYLDESGINDIESGNGSISRLYSSFSSAGIVNNDTIVTVTNEDSAVDIDEEFSTIQLPQSGVGISPDDDDENQSHSSSSNNWSIDDDLGNTGNKGGTSNWIWDDFITENSENNSKDDWRKRRLTTFPFVWVPSFDKINPDKTPNEITVEKAEFLTKVGAITNAVIEDAHLYTKFEDSWYILIDNRFIFIGDCSFGNWIDTLCYCNGFDIFDQLDSECCCSDDNCCCSDDDNCCCIDNDYYCSNNCRCYCCSDDDDDSNGYCIFNLYYY